jgi:hypothetical protein
MYYLIGKVFASTNFCAFAHKREFVSPKISKNSTLLSFNHTKQMPRKRRGRNFNEVKQYCPKKLLKCLKITCGIATGYGVRIKWAL